MGIKPASFFHEVTLLKKDSKNRNAWLSDFYRINRAVVISNRTITFWFY